MIAKNHLNLVSSSSGIRFALRSVTAAILTFATLVTVPIAVAKDKKPFPDVRIPGFLRNEQAIQALGDKFPEIAAWYGKDPEELKELLRHDRDLWASPSGRLMYACELELPSTAPAETPTGTTRVQAGTIPLDQTFQLHSDPNSQKVLYLDFKGAMISGTAWNATYFGGKDFYAAPFDMDGDPLTFSSTELQLIQNVWRRVSEDYSAFDIDITTEEPAQDAITRSSNSDTIFGTRVMITPSNFYPNVGGISYIGAFDDVGDYYKPSFAFSNMLLNGEKYIAEACSHESGHAFGLHHEGKTDGTVYYQGQGNWAPIMGNSYYATVTQWCKGEYAGANNTEDQLQVMQNFGLTYYPDDHGNTPATATFLTGTTAIIGSGFIERNTDVDVFKFLTGAGSISINVESTPLGPDLAVKTELRDSNWNLVVTPDPTGLSTNMSATVPAGTYYIVVAGTGEGDPVTTGFSSYASLGQYTISGTIVDPGSLNPPTAVASATPISGNAPLTVQFIGSNSTDVPSGSIVSYLWSFGDAASSTAMNPSHVYGMPGTYTAILTVTDNDGLTGAASLNISVLDSVFVGSIGMAVQGSTSVSANATVVVNELGSKPVAGATVSGTWSGLVQGSATGTTGSDGSVMLTSPATSNSGTITFTINSVSSPGYSYDPTLNRMASATINANPTPPALPTVSITAPTSGATVAGTVNVQVSASSSLGVASVTLIVCGASLGTDTRSPYTFSWNTANSNNGSCTLNATVKDKAGNTAVASVGVTVSNFKDTTPPTIAIIAPQQGSAVSGNVSIQVDARDNVGVVKVEMYVDGKLTSTSSMAPFTTKWNTTKVTKGQHTLTCKAYDAARNAGSTSISVNK